MRLQNAKKYEKCIIKEININDVKLKLRLFEIGFYPGSTIKILNFSFLHKTLLVQVLDSCFAIKSNVAENIEVDYE